MSEGIIPQMNEVERRDKQQVMSKSVIKVFMSQSDKTLFEDCFTCIKLLPWYPDFYS